MQDRDYSQYSIYRKVEEPGEWKNYLVKYSIPGKKSIKRIFRLAYSVVEQRFANTYYDYGLMMEHPILRQHVAEVERIARETTR